MRALLTGWFSFRWMGATAGDLLVADVVGQWLEAAGCPYDRAVAETVGEGVDAMTVDPLQYSHLVFACGPLGAGEPATSLFERFSHARLVGVDLSMLQPLADWNPFDLLLERDSSRASRPDLALMADVTPVPLIAAVLVHEQREYDRGRHRQVHETIQGALARMSAAVIPVDTCFDPPNTTGLRSPAEVLSVLARMDVIVTTRLHGLVLGLKVGVPVVAVDPVAGGAKVSRQAAALDWQEVLTPEDATEAAITAAIDRCLSADARERAQTRARKAREELDAVRDRFLVEFTATESSS